MYVNLLFIPFRLNGLFYQFSHFPAVLFNPLFQDFAGDVQGQLHNLAADIFQLVLHPFIGFPYFLPQADGEVLHR